MNPAVSRALLRLNAATTLTVRDARSILELNALAHLTRRGLAEWVRCVGLVGADRRLIRTGQYVITDAGRAAAAKEIP